MKRVFNDFATYVRLHDGHDKPRINFQNMYKLFPNFEFTSTKDFGNYENFGEAFENKNLSMIVSDGKNECIMIYKEYYDTNENTAYVS